MSKPCPRPVHQKRKKKRVNARRELEKQLEALVREIVFWRDGNTCIEKDLDGARCGGGVQWGHIVPRSRSTWLKFTIQNTACQCANHNLLHRHNDPTMYAVVGEKRLGALRDEMMAHRGEKPTMDDMKCRMEVYQMLWDTRPSVFSRQDLIDGGYYGLIRTEALPDANREGEGGL